MKEVKPFIPSHLVNASVLHWPPIIGNIQILMDDLEYGLIIMSVTSKEHRIILLQSPKNGGVMRLPSGTYSMSGPAQLLQGTGFSLEGSQP
jgi:hypothetical protein